MLLSLFILILFFLWFFKVRYTLLRSSFLSERSRAIREVNLRTKQLSEPTVMYFHICKTKALNRWKLVSYYEKGKESGGRKREGKRKEMKNKRDEDRKKEKEQDRKVETEKERNTGSTVFFVHKRFVDFPENTVENKSPRLSAPNIERRFSASVDDEWMPFHTESRIYERNRPIVRQFSSADIDAASCYMLQLLSYIFFRLLTFSELLRDDSLTNNVL